MFRNKPSIGNSSFLGGSWILVNQSLLFNCQRSCFKNSIRYTQSDQIWRFKIIFILQWPSNSMKHALPSIYLQSSNMCWYFKVVLSSFKTVTAYNSHNMKVESCVDLVVSSIQTWLVMWLVTCLVTWLVMWLVMWLVTYSNCNNIRRQKKRNYGETG